MLRRITLGAALAVSIACFRFGAAMAADAPGGLSVPAGLQGAWYVGQSCSNVTSYIFRGDGWRVAISQPPDKETIVADSSPFEVRRVDPDGSMIVSSYWINPATGDHVPATLKLTPSGAALEGTFVSPPQAANAPKLSEVRCDNPEIQGKPWPLASYYLSGLTFLLGTASGVQGACSGGAHACAEAVIGVLDLNHDGKVSRAELVSFFRRASKLGLLIGKTIPGTNISRATFTLDQVAGTGLAGAVIGPIFADILIANIDFNGDGFIEEGELETFLHQIGMPPAQGYFGQLVRSTRQSAAQAARSLGALEGILGAFGGH